MLGILLRENSMLCRNLPVDAQALVEDRDSPVSLRMIELIALILEHGSFAEYGKTMGKTTWNKELAMIILRQFHRHMLTVCWRTLTDIHGYIQYSPFHTSHQLALCKRRSLEMQATHCITPYELIAFQEFSWLICIYKYSHTYFPSSE